MKNLLKKTRSYLIGNLENSSTYYSWRDEITKFLESINVIVLSPLTDCLENQVSEDDDQRNLNKKLALERTPESLAKVHDYMRRVVRRDLRMVDMSDFVIASLEVEKPTYGSVHEVIMASLQRKPIFIHIEEGQRIPLWLLGFISPHNFYSSLDDIKIELSKIDSGETPMDYKNWRILKEEYR